MATTTTTTTTATTTKHEWIVILPDQDSALQRRMQVRPDHLKNLKPNIDNGFWLFGGAFLEEPIKEGEGPKIKGSVMLALAESRDEVMSVLRRDVYAENEVWDFEKVQIYPFKSAIRKAL